MLSPITTGHNKGSGLGRSLRIGVVEVWLPRGLTVPAAVPDSDRELVTSYAQSARHKPRPRGRTTEVSAFRKTDFRHRRPTLLDPKATYRLPTDAPRGGLRDVL